MSKIAKHLVPALLFSVMECLIFGPLLLLAGSTLVDGWSMIAAGGLMLAFAAAGCAMFMRMMGGVSALNSLQTLQERAAMLATAAEEAKRRTGPSRRAH